MSTQEDDLPIYDVIEIEDMTFDSALELYHYPCPCGDRFQIGLLDLRNEEDIAVCPSCSLMIRVIFDLVCVFLCLLSGVLVFPPFFPLPALGSDARSQHRPS